MTNVLERIIGKKGFDRDLNLWLLSFTILFGGGLMFLIWSALR